MGKIKFRPKNAPRPRGMTVAAYFRQDYSGQDTSAEMRSVHQRLDGMTPNEVRGMFKDLINKDADLSGRAVWLLAQGIEYHALREGYVRVHGEVPKEVEKRYKLSIAFDIFALKQESYFVSNGPDRVARSYTIRGESPQGETTMAKKQGSKEKKEARTTASSVLIRLLGAAHVKSDEDIIEVVKEETGSSKFDAKQLAWYKWKYRQGALKGMDGKSHVIEQGDNKKKAKAEKAPKAKKKIIIKDRRTKKDEVAE